MTDRFHKRLWQNAVSLSRGSRSAHESLHVIEDLHECSVCGLFQHVPELEPGHLAECRRCGTQIARRRKTSLIGAPAAFCLASAALYVALLISPILTLNVFGRENTVAVMSGPIEISHQGYHAAGLLIAVTTLVMPGVIIGLMGAILYGASRKEMPDWTPRLLTWYERLRGWSMVEVYVLGVLVAYTKLVDLALVELQPGIYLLGGLMLTMAATDSTFDHHQIWDSRSVRERVRGYHGRALEVTHLRAVEDVLPPVEHMMSCHACGLVVAFDHVIPQEADMGDCPRCDQVLRRRKRQGLASATCFLIAGILFYIPANILPVMTYVRVGHGAPSTIVGGAIELWKADLIPLALLVLFASITVPVLKILVLSFMILTTKMKWNWKLPLLGKLYRLVDIIGRWSMIDVFMISILCAVVRFSFLANVTADAGMVCFALVVILTIFAVELFDPRGMWDAAGLNSSVPDASREGKPEAGAPVSSTIAENSSDMEPERA